MMQSKYYTNTLLTIFITLIKKSILRVSPLKYQISQFNQKQVQNLLFFNDFIRMLKINSKENKSKSLNPQLKLTDQLQNIVQIILILEIYYINKDLSKNKLLSINLIKKKKNWISQIKGSKIVRWKTYI